MAAPEISDLNPDERDIVSVGHDWVEASVRPVARPRARQRLPGRAHMP